MESFRHRVRTPSPAMIVALLALFVALSGGAAAGTYVAAKELGPRSTSVEAGRARILNLVAARVAYLRTHPAGVHQLQRCCPGPRGRRGPRGPRGFPGPPGARGLTILTSRNGPIVHMCAFGGGGCEVAESIALCPTGTVPVGGAWSGDAPDALVSATVGASFPYPSNSPPTGWGLIVINNAPVTASFHTAVMCAD
jgi:hypothetical protein